MMLSPYIDYMEGLQAILKDDLAYPNVERWYAYAARRGHKAGRRKALQLRSARKFRRQLNRRRARK